MNKTKSELTAELETVNNRIAELEEKNRSLEEGLNDQQTMMMDMEKAYFEQERRIHKRLAELADKNQTLQNEIHEHQHTQAHLQASERALKLFTENAPAAIAYYFRFHADLELDIALDALSDTENGTALYEIMILQGKNIHEGDCVWIISIKSDELCFVTFFLTSRNIPHLDRAIFQG